MEQELKQTAGVYYRLAKDENGEHIYECGWRPGGKCKKDGKFLKKDEAYQPRLILVTIADGTREDMPLSHNFTDKNKSDDDQKAAIAKGAFVIYENKEGARICGVPGDAVMLKWEE